MSAKNLRTNMLFAALLLALLVGLLSNIIAEQVVDTQEPKTVAYLKNITPPQHSTINEPPPSIEGITIRLKKASSEKGQRVVRRCLQCHSIEKEGPQRLGPPLWNIVGRLKAVIHGYPYSAAALKQKGTPWTEKDIDDFLTAPQQYMPGTKMAFAGIKNPQDRAHLIAFLKKLTKST